MAGKKVNKSSTSEQFKVLGEMCHYMFPDLDIELQKDIEREPVVGTFAKEGDAMPIETPDNQKVEL